MIPQIPATPKSASINRIRIVELPGCNLDDAVRGEQAYHLLSAPALIRYAQAQGDALRLPPRLHHGHPEDPEIRQDLPRYVNTCLGSDDATIRTAARAIARRLGRNLGYILLALHRGDLANRAARADWSDAEWAAWGAIRQVWLGGGVISGTLGATLIEDAHSLLAATGYGADIKVSRTPRPKDMALLGAARYLPPPARPGITHALCLDLGQTSIKRALATITAHGQLAHLDRLPPVAVPWRWRNSPDAGKEIDGEAVLDVVSRAVADGFKVAEAMMSPGEVLSRDVAMSIAAYVRHGALLGNGIYARMQRMTANIQTLIAERVTERVTQESAYKEVTISTSQPPRLHVIHDGTAAAALHAGEPHSAIIVVGTALGVGFAPADAAPLRGIAAQIK
jgi:hypothetical protein